MLVLEDWIVDRQRRDATHLPSGERVPLVWLYRRARVEGEIIPACLFRVPEPDDDELREQVVLSWEEPDEWELSQVREGEEEEWSVLDSNQ